MPSMWLHLCRYPTVLARYGVKQVSEGRRVGSSLNSNDVTSRYAQKKRGFSVERLFDFDESRGQWREAMVEDHNTPVPDQAAFRIDFPEWLDQLPPRNRRIAESLTTGKDTSEVAHDFAISPGRVSQLRRELANHWAEFHGEAMTTDN